MSQPVETQTDANAPASTETQEGQVTAPEGNSSDTWTIDDYKRELGKVRSEAASRRVALREQEEQAKKWAAYEESQKTELQKLQDQLAEREKALSSKDQEILRSKIAREFNVADDDLDLLVGDEENMKRLASRLGAGTHEEPPTGGNTPANLLAGNRGKPIGGANSTAFSVDKWIRGDKQ